MDWLFYIGGWWTGGLLIEFMRKGCYKFNRTTNPNLDILNSIFDSIMWTMLWIWICINK